VVGSLLAQNWWLPGEICAAIRHHHSLPALVESVSPLKMPGRQLVAIAQTAEYLLQQITGGSRTEEWAKLGPACRDLLRLDDATLEAIRRDAEPLLRGVE